MTGTVLPRSPSRGRRPDARRSAETWALLRRYHELGDRKARERLIERFLPLVRQIAVRYRGRGVPLDDLVQAGTIGLINSIDRFDVDRGVELTTYATPTILGEIKRYFRDHGWAVHVPRPVLELEGRIETAGRQLANAFGRTPTIPELADALDVDEEDLLEALEARRGFRASSTAGKTAGDDEEGDPLERLGRDDPGFDRADARAVLCDGLRELDPRAQRIVLLSFACGLTQAQIAVEIGCSQMHVSRLLRAALDALHESVDDTTRLPA